MYCEPITKDEIVTVCAFQNNNFNKSPGPDNIGPKLLKSVLIHIVDPLQFIFNLSFANGCVSQSLKIAKVIPLFKQEAQLMLTNPREAFSSQSRSPNIVSFHMLGIVSSSAMVTL